MLDEAQIRAPHFVEVTRPRGGRARFGSSSGLALNENLERCIELIEQPPETIQPSHPICFRGTVEGEWMGAELRDPGASAPQDGWATRTQAHKAEAQLLDVASGAGSRRALHTTRYRRAR